MAMHRRSSSTPTSASSSSYLSSLSITAVVQYAFFAALAYILAGAPLASLLTSRADSDISSLSTGLGAQSDGKANLENLVIPERNLSCAAHAYKGVYLMSREPLVVYIEGFVSEEEGKEVVELRYVCCWLVIFFSCSYYDVEERERCFPWESLEPVRLHGYLERKQNKTASLFNHS